MSDEEYELRVLQAFGRWKSTHERPADRYYPVFSAEDVTDEILANAEMIVDGCYPNGPVDGKVWGNLWKRLQLSLLPDHRLIDLGSELDTPAIRKIKKHVVEREQAREHAVQAEITEVTELREQLRIVTAQRDHWVAEAFRLAALGGWSAFGSHQNMVGRLEFDGVDADDLLPMWERLKGTPAYETAGAADWRAVVAELADDDDDDLDVVCANGCPEGALGRHKFSCPLAVATRLPTEDPTEGSTS